jgi:hypothetical protein
MYHLLLVSLVSLLCLGWSADDSGGEDLRLEYVQMVWRHGDRSPMLFYPNDPHRHYWPQGNGQLTQLGMQQQYELGRFLRTRYDGFMSQYYLNNETYILSSNIDRAIESASCNMASFYQPTGWQVWNSSIMWQPVPVHTLDREQDHFLDVLWEQCPKWVDIDQHFQHSDLYVAYERDFADFFDRFSVYAGVQVNMSNAGLLYDNLLCVKSHNLSLPEWATDHFMASLDNVTNFGFFNLFRTREQQRLLGGSLFRVIREMFYGKVNKLDLYSQNLMAYSGHDTTIMGLASLLGVFNNLRPPYVTTMIFELFSDSKMNHFIKLSYHNSSSEEPYPLKMKFCRDILCPYEEFFNASSNLTVDDWDKECSMGLGELTAPSPYYKTSPGGNVTRFLLTGTGFVFFVLLMFLVIECYCLYVKRRVLDPRKLKLEISFTSALPAEVSTQAHGIDKTSYSS